MATNKSVHLNKTGITILGKTPTSGNLVTLPDEEISDLVSGTDHAVIVCKSGRVYVFGNNERNQCGLDINKCGKTIDTPILLESLSSHNIIKVACGQESSFFLTSSGKLYVCGYNNLYQLGLGHCNNCPSPTKVTSSANVKSVAAAGYHSMALIQGGKVCGSGRNIEGELGLGNREKQSSTVVSIPEACIAVYCGIKLNIVMTASGKIYATGDFAGPDASHKKDSFNAVTLPSAVLDVACGESHAVILMADESVWCFGKNNFGQLGVGTSDFDCHAPVPCSLPRNLSVQKVFASYCSSGVITKEGEAWLWGHAVGGKLGQLGDKVLTPTLVSKSPELIVRQLALGLNYTLLLCEQKPKSAKKIILLNSNLTELEKAVISSLECCVCMKVMSAPIYQCILGHNLCSSCKPQVTLCPSCCSPFQGARNFSLEEQSAMLRIPCMQCSEPLPVTDIEPHDLVCSKRECCCIIMKNCTWRGSTDQVLGHVTQTHPHQVWHGSPQVFKYACTGDQVEARVWSVNSDIFVLYWKYEAGSQSLQAAAMQIGIFAKPVKYKLKMKYLDDNKNMKSRTSNIAVYTDRVDEIFKTSSLIDIKAYKHGCQVFIVQQEICDTFLALIESLSLQ